MPLSDPRSAAPSAASPSPSSGTTRPRSGFTPTQSCCLRGLSSAASSLTGRARKCHPNPLLLLRLLSLRLLPLHLFLLPLLSLRPRLLRPPSRCLRPLPCLLPKYCMVHRHRPRRRGRSSAVLVHPIRPLQQPRQRSPYHQCRPARQRCCRLPLLPHRRYNSSNHLHCSPPWRWQATSSGAIALRPPNHSHHHR